MHRWLLVPLALALLSPLAAQAGTRSSDDLREGDAVWAEWKVNAWYHGTITKVTTRGYVVVFDDGDVAALKSSAIALDLYPDTDTVRLGSRVLGLWRNGRFYPGRVAAVKSDGTFTIDYDDGDRGTVGPKGMRLIAP